MENLNNEGLRATAPSFSTRARRPHTRRNGRNTLGLPRESRKFEGELPSDQRWVVGHEGRYAISAEGMPYRYYADGSCRALKVVTRGKQKYMHPFVDEDKRWLRISNVLAQSFLGTSQYVFFDGDSLNVRLDNIAPIDAVMQPDEVPVEGFDGMYTIDSTGVVHSYKQNQRKKLKQCNSSGKSKRVCLTDKDGLQETLYLAGKYLVIH